MTGGNGLATGQSTWVPPEATVADIDDDMFLPEVSGLRAAVHSGRMIGAVAGHPRRRWLAIAGAIIGLSALGWVFWRTDYDRLSDVFAKAEVGFLFLIPSAIAAEQLIRAWKWRQLLHDIRPIRTLRLFGAIMAGYFANLVIPVGVSPFVRSWLVGRMEALRMSAVLATVAIDRFVDGVIFTGFVAVALIFTVFPDPTGDIRVGLSAGGALSLFLFAGLLFSFAHYKRHVQRLSNRLHRLIRRLPDRIAERAWDLLQSFAAGIVWPRAAWRGLGVVLAGVGIKIVAVTHFLWAGLAFGVVLGLADYVFLMVFLGFAIITTRLARIPGGFLVGSIFALELFGVAKEHALAMALAIQFANLLTVGGIGAFALWRNGVAIEDVRAAGKDRAEKA